MGLARPNERKPEKAIGCKIARHIADTPRDMDTYRQSISTALTYPLMHAQGPPKTVSIR